MRNVVEKFADLEREIAAKRGPFALFALLAREDLPDRWDLVVSADWIRDQREAVEYLAGEIKPRLGSEQLVELSRIVVAPVDAPPVLAMNQSFRVEHGMAEIRDSILFGLPIRHAFVITSQHVTPSAA